MALLVTAARFPWCVGGVGVDALRQYKAQTVEGGMGEGGALGVQGGTTRASKEVKP